ncbi:MAG TPA: hypothetical protein VGB15_09720 [Longimicrobium sp.]|jgi:hypothetical protein
MTTETIIVTCPGCAQRVTPAQGLVCPSCGAVVAAEYFAAQAEKIAAITARARTPARRGPSTVNGWGTTLLDYRPRGDGTWDATRWFTIAHLPIVPLRHQRVRPVSREALIAGERYRYEMLEEGKPELKRVLWVYALAVAAVFPAAFFFFNLDLMRRVVGPGGFGLFVGACLIVWGGFLATRIHNGDRAYKAAEKNPTEPTGAVVVSDAR